jgi:hypothetical protein
MTADTHPPDPAPVLSHIKDWYAGHHQEVTAPGVAVTLQHSPPDRNKASIAVSFDAGPRLASLIIWDTGETELDLADIHSGTHIPQHHDIGSPAEVDHLLSQILA